MTVSIKLEPDGTKLLFIGDVKIPRGFTPETTLEEVERFRALCEAQESELLILVTEYLEKQAWNWAESRANRMGRNWPIFNKTTKFLDRLQKAANISDS